MAAPQIVSVSPPDGATGVLLQEPIEVLFDQEVDIDTIVLGGNFVVAQEVYRVIKTGPQPLDYESALDPDYLYSRGYKGLIQGTSEFFKVDLSSLDEHVGVDTTGDGHLWRTKVLFIPEQTLTESTAFSVIIGTGLSSRTLFDVVETKTGTGSIEPHGPYTGLTTEIYHLEITTGGNRKQGIFKWWKESDMVEHTSVSLDRFPVELEEGISIKFLRGIYEVGDEFSFVAKPGEATEAISGWTFQTGLSNAEAPPEPSAPLIGAEIVTDSGVNQNFLITSISPEHGASNMPLTTTQIIFTFNSNIDESTVTTNSLYAEGVLVMNYWSEGMPIPSGITAMGEIPLSWVVSGNLLIVTLDVGSGGELLSDNEIRIWLTSDIKNVSGEALNNYMYYFTTRYTPIYADISQVFARIGGIIGTDFPEDIIYRLLLRYSILADLMNPAFAATNGIGWKLLSSEWVLCSTIRDLLLNLPTLSGMSGGKKRLADLSVQQPAASDSAAVLKQMLDCTKKFETLMMNRGGTSMAVAVKGAYNPEEPNFGRRIDGFLHPTFPIVNETWSQLIPGGKYTTARMMRKILGNYRPGFGGN